MIISKTQLQIIRTATDEILLNKYDYYNSMPIRTLTALLNLKAIKQELDRRNLLDLKINEDQYEMEAASLWINLLKTNMYLHNHSYKNH